MSPLPSDAELNVTVIDPEGQHRSVGWVLVGMGGLGIVLGLSLTLMGVVGPGFFIDGPTAMIIGLVTGGLGYWQHRLADDHRR